ncbi:hypothetical protein BN2476_460062 [Paraburkholderia piptadeniae]|uniref:Uncharacterized protein n=1 Tax=Paraburkholderia piptadeniae TaxID=1701573 RepID=A0A1N7SCQ8_9BURK|nr:hypothetical protein BN2476_460062 [Paraburkholderia piptadeniae]
MIGQQVVLHQAREKRARARADDEHAPRADDRFDGGFGGCAVDRVACRAEIRGGLLQRRAEEFVAIGLRLLRRAQAFDGRERCFETAHERFAKRRIAVETERARKAISRRDGCADGRRQFVDTHGRRAKLVGQHEFAHAPVDGREDRHRGRDARGDGRLGGGRGRRVTGHRVVLVVCVLENVSKFTSNVYGENKFSQGDRVFTRGRGTLYGNLSRNPQAMSGVIAAVLHGGIGLRLHRMTFGK